MTAISRPQGLLPAALFEEAGKCKSMADFSRVLKVLAEFHNAQGCALWEKVPFQSR